MFTYIKTIAKAIASGLAAFIGALVLALSLQPVEHQGIQYLSQAQWGIIALSVLASYGITWRVPNETGGLPGEATTTNNPNPVSSPEPIVLPTSAPQTTFPTGAAPWQQPAVTVASGSTVIPPVQTTAGGALK